MQSRITYSLFDESNDLVQTYYESDWVDDFKTLFTKEDKLIGTDVPITGVIEALRVSCGMLMRFPMMQTCQLSFTRPATDKPSGYYFKLLVRAKL